MQLAGHVEERTCGERQRTTQVAPPIDRADEMSCLCSAMAQMRRKASSNLAQLLTQVENIATGGGGQSTLREGKGRPDRSRIPWEGTEYQWMERKAVD